LIDESEIPIKDSSLDQSGKKTILICDDQRDFVSTCTLALRSNFNVIKAHSGAECLNYFRENASGGRVPDVVLMDYQLGDMRADEVLEKMKLMGVRSPRTKILIISGMDELSMSGNSIEVSELRKPFSLEQLKKQIDLILR
jgi:response regulator RpfG family c-di-GMP phosphodiesterase